MSFDGTGPMQPELWRALAAMAPVTLHRPLNEQRYIEQACTHACAFFLAKIGMIWEFLKEKLFIMSNVCIILYQMVLMGVIIVIIRL